MFPISLFESLSTFEFWENSSRVLSQVVNQIANFCIDFITSDNLICGAFGPDIVARDRQLARFWIEFHDVECLTF